MTDSGIKRCIDCKNFEHGEDVSDGFILSVWSQCLARAGVGNLRQFPFQKTQCPKFKEQPS